jgi:hypothetical protein
MINNLCKKSVKMNTNTIYGYDLCRSFVSIKLLRNDLQYVNPALTYTLVIALLFGV